MKTLIILLACFAPGVLVAQTYKMETDYLNSRIFSHEITGTEALDMKKNLDAACDSVNGYPVLPYDTLTKTFNFTYVLDCSGVPQKVVFKRVKEWCALRYADIDNVLRYEDIDAGKLITKGYTPITYLKTFKGIFGGKHSSYETIKCYHTLIFTCIEGKIKVEVKDLRYLYVYGGYSYGGTYIPRVETEIYLNAMFPIIKNDKVEWAGLMDLAKQTASVYSDHAADLKRYILNWEKDYKF